MVSNSSSMCFILDTRNEEVIFLIEECIAERTNIVARSTSIWKGEDVRFLAKEWLREMYDPPEMPSNDSLGHWLLKWYEKLDGNIALFRESDEGVGGFLFPNHREGTRLFAAMTTVKDPVQAAKWGSLLPASDPYVRMVKLALDSMEYHGY